MAFAIVAAAIVFALHGLSHVILQADAKSLSLQMDDSNSLTCGVCGAMFSYVKYGIQGQAITMVCIWFFSNRSTAF